MLCERCGEREANVRFTEVINGETTEHNLCMQCAQSMDFGASPYAALFDGESQLGRLISGLLGFQAPGSRKSQESRLDNVVCPVCHTSYADFVKTTRFGCPDCYEVFDLLIQDSIKQIQGSDTHKGKHPKYGLRMVPKSLTEELKGSSAEAAAEGHASAEEGAVISAEDPKMNRISELRAMLNKAVSEENFEEAAALRDQIRTLERED